MNMKSTPLSRFPQHLQSLGRMELRKGLIGTLQVNMGKRCNQACLHCHVEAGPKRTEMMPSHCVDQILALLKNSPSVLAVDITGGAPELNPFFRTLVGGAHRLNKRVLVRCNLTVVFVNGQEDLISFYADHGVELLCSLPCYEKENVDQQRGGGVFDQSIEALRKLNAHGYGKTGSNLILNLVYNPVKAALPSPQEALEQTYRDELRERFGIVFNHLFTITNMPIGRFAEDLRRQGKMQEYLDLLVQNFNPGTLDGLMCRSLVSVDWRGRLFDCDFNQMLNLPLRSNSGKEIALSDVGTLSELENLGVATDSHCFGCTAGAGSSCQGELMNKRSG